MAVPAGVSDRVPLVGSVSSTKVSVWPDSLAGPVLPVRKTSWSTESSSTDTLCASAVGASLTQLTPTDTVAAAEVSTPPLAMPPLSVTWKSTALAVVQYWLVGVK